MDTGKSTGLVESLKDSLIPIAILAGVITHRVRVAISLDKMTLNYGSIMQLYVKRYKTDPHDETIAINARIVKPSNTDFDGDELYGMWIFEDKLAQYLSAAHPSQFILSTQNVGLSDAVGQLDQNWVTLENYLYSDPDIDHYEEL